MHDPEIERHLDILKETPKRLAMALAGLPAPLVDWTPAPGRWSILEIVCHMRDMEREAYRDRYARILAEDEPFLRDVDGDLCALTGGYDRQALGDVLAEWQVLREESLALLSRVTSWSRAGRHETIGPVTLRVLLRRHAIGNDEAHVSQILSIRERWKLLSRLASAPERVAEAIRGVPEEALRAEPAPGKWSIAANVSHLRDVERVYANRLTRTAFSDDPELMVADNDSVAAANRYAEADAREALAQYARRREETLILLRALHAPVWKRTGTHPTRGRLSLAQLASELADHDDDHLRRIAELAEGYVAPERVRVCS